MTNRTPGNQRPDSQRVIALNALVDAINTGLPAPDTISFYDGSLYVDFRDIGVTAIDAWAETLGLDAADGFQRNRQPYPLVEPFEKWTESAWTREPWHGFRVTVKTDEPVTGEHRRWWVDSGRATRQAAHTARKAAAGGAA